MFLPPSSSPLRSAHISSHRNISGGTVQSDIQKPNKLRRYLCLVCVCVCVKDKERRISRTDENDATSGTSIPCGFTSHKDCFRNHETLTHRPQCGTNNLRTDGTPLWEIPQT